MSKTQTKKYQPTIDRPQYERGTVADGSRLRVPLHLMDAMQKDVKESFAKIMDANELARHRPGFRTADTDTSKDRRKLYDKYDLAKANEYKRDDSGAGESEFIGAVAGDSCTINGNTGTLQYTEGGDLICVPDDDGEPDTASDAKSKAYDAYDAELRNAYRR